MQVLEAEAVADLLPAPASSAAARSIAIAVNDDSLQTWFLDALAALHDAHGYLFDIQVDDQDHTLELLRSGAVLGAVTSVGKALQGCNVLSLGAMRYRAIASPAFFARYFADGLDAAALARAPMIVYNRKDALQARFVRRITRARLHPPIHYLPTSIGFVEAAARGLGWCLAPEPMLVAALRQRQIVVVDPQRWLDVPLYWQHVAVRSRTLQHIAQALRAAAEGMHASAPLA
ncbi:putative HTH-type transcriptional regulator [Xanthomonas sacchari]|nr:putative HTH-type transcriptional regulator [Xanthomonas sacchari]